LHTASSIFGTIAPPMQRLDLLLDFVCHVYKRARYVDIHHPCTNVQLGMPNPDLSVLKLDSDWF
jgi:hypothetical protein